MIPLKYIQIFSIEELEMLINGVPKLSFEDWQLNTEYKGEFHPKHKIIHWFWTIMKTLSQQQLSKILYFCTGSTRISLEGFK